MQKFLITIKDNHGGPVTAEWLQNTLDDMDMEVTVTEILQPPFASGMDKNVPYQINVPGEPMPKTIFPKGYYPESAPCGASIWGTPDDIDSGIRHHMSFCARCQQIREENGSDTP